VKVGDAAGSAAGAGDDVPTLYLIDGHAQFFRAYYAIRGGMSSAVTGEPTHLVFGFVSMLLKLLRDERPKYLAVAIDVSGDRETFRTELYPEYKANREKAPEDFHPQVERCLEILRGLAIPVIGIEGVEADDVIATIVRRTRAEHPEMRVRIVSRDKDLVQLTGDGVEMFDAMKDEVVTADALFKTEGVEPRHVADILALMGDTSDNIPGVPGVGPKKAAKLVLDHGSLEALLERLDEVKGKLGENLRAHAEQIPLSRRLVSLLDDVDLDFDAEDARVDPAAMDVDTVTQLFTTLSFNSHGDSLRRIVGAEAAPAGSGPASSSPAAAAKDDDDDGAGTLFARPGAAAAAPDGEPPLPPPNGDYTTITDVDALDALLARIRAAGRAAVDTETDSLHARTANLCGLALAVTPGEGFYVPVRSPSPETHLDLDTVIARARPVLESPDLEIVGHNLKFDLVVLRRHGIVPRGRLRDTMVADYLLEPTRSSHSMDALAESLLDIRCVPISTLLGGKGRGRKAAEQKTFDQVALDRAGPYSSEDADITLRLADTLLPRVGAEATDARLAKLYDDVEMPLVRVIAEMEWNGIRVDPDELDRQREHLQARIESLVEEISGAAPHPFDPGSPKQLAAVLFNGPEDEPPGLGLPVQKRGKTGPSTDAEVLEKLAGDPELVSPIPGLILEYRQLTKLVSTYLVALKEAVSPETGRIHASFNQTVTATGRLSSSDPNLQNIPIRTDVGRAIRRAFVAADGCELLAADYSQIELRILAHLSEDAALIEAFRAGADIHRTVAAEVFGVAPEDVTDAQRGSAKMVNFGIIYGITAFGLARRLGGNVSREEAARIIEDYRARFPGIDAFLQRCIDEARDTGSVTTILGRRRPIDMIDSRNAAQRALGERTAINTVVQGSAADLIKVAMVDVHRDLPEAFPDARLLLQIHDELVLEVPREQGAALEAFVVERMSGAMRMRVPLDVGAARSERWIDAK
jgi:DNA polymerase-1